VLSIKDSRNKRINTKNKKWEVIKGNGVSKQHIYSYDNLLDAHKLAKKHDGYTVRGKLTYKGKGMTTKEQKAFVALCHYVEQLWKEAA
jgi:hypothetical protein